MDGVTSYISGHQKWKAGLEQLRSILLEYPFEEQIKWNAPVYSAYGRNLVGMAAFKNHFSLWFYEGYRLTDTEGILENAQEGKTKYLRHWKFSNAEDIDPELLRAFLRETLKLAAETPAPAAEKNDTTAENSPTAPALEEALKGSGQLREAFDRLPPYKQREFSEYIEEAKREDTKAKRLERSIALILKGAGLNDKYRN